MDPRFGLRPIRTALSASALALLIVLPLSRPSTAGAAGPPSPASIDPPAAEGSLHFAVAAEGATTVTDEHHVLMTWLEPGGTLRFARFSQGEWLPPITIATGVSPPSPGDSPSLTVIETQSVRRTLIARTGDVVARSGDAGRTWNRLPSDDLAHASFAGGDEGAFAFWLGGQADAPAQLMGTRVLAGGTVLDADVETSSGTAAAMTWDGPLVTYLDQSDEGAVQISTVRRENADWTPPRPMYAEVPAATPAGTPRIAALRRQVVVGWYSEADSTPRLMVAFSSNAGRSFGAPIQVEAQEGDRVPWNSFDVALDDNGQALVLWTATDSPAEASLNLARVSPEGQVGRKMVLAKRHPSRVRKGARVARADDRLAAAWIEGSPGRLRTLAVPLAALPVSIGPDAESRAAAAREPATAVGGERAGEIAPDLELISLEGERVSLPALRGRPVLLNLWATWCLPCLAEMPALAILHERYASQGLVLVGASVDTADARDRVQEFVTQRGIPFAIWLDPDMHLAGALRVRSFPATFVIDRSGHIVLRRDEPIESDDPEIRAAIRRVIGDS